MSPQEPLTETDATVARLERMRPRIIGELHPVLRARVIALLSDLGGRLTPYCGYRDEAAQAKAKAAGYSNAAFGESPHNYRPALACDLVLHPLYVSLPPSKSDPRYPDLWCSTDPAATDAWGCLEYLARRRNLDRVDVGGKRDLPHVQLPEWRRYVGP